MGLIKHLLFWPVTGPNFLARFSLEKVQDAVKEQLTDDQVVKEELLALQMQLELGEIEDHQYVEREAALMQRLRDVRRWREEFGMGTSGGPVRVSGGGPNVAEDVVASPEGTDDRQDAEAEPELEGEEEGGRRGGIASSEGASVEFNLDWE